MRTHGQICVRTQILHICKICIRMQIWSCVHSLRRNRIQKRSAIYKNRRSKRIENTHFAFICTICTRVQIWCKFAYEPSFRELRMEDNSSSSFNYMRMEPLMFDEILKSVSHRIQENDAHFRKALEPGIELERILRSWRDDIFVSAAQSPVA